MLILIAMVMLMAAGGRGQAAPGFRVGERIVLVIAGCLLVFGLFALIVDRAL